MILVRFQGKPFSIKINKVYIPTTDAKGAEIDQFYVDLQHFLELHIKVVLFIIGAWNAKVRSQEIPGVTSKFDLGVQNEAGQG